MAVAAAIGKGAAGPTPAPVSGVTRAMRRLRAAQLEQVHAAVSSGAARGRSGYRSSTDWLMATTGESVGQCKLTLHLADRIQHMPVVKAAFAAGDLSESALRLLADAWHPDTAVAFARDEQMLTGWAETMPHSDFKLVLDTWRMHADHDLEQAAADGCFDRRALHVSTMLDGVGRLDGTLDPEGLRLVRAALRTLAARAPGDTRTPAQRRADALVAMARLTLDAHERPKGTKRWRPKLVATVDYHDLRDRAGGGLLDSDDGPTTLTAEALRRLACDAGVHRYVADTPDHKVHYGRETRSVSDALFDVLFIRDHHCRWSGCTVPAGACDAHHAVHWLDRGETEPDNLILLCWYHHHLLHEQHWRIEPLGAGHFQLTEPNGTPHPLRPPLVGLAPPAEPPQPLPLQHAT